MINIADMTNLYISLTNSVTSKLDALYIADKIDAETYAKIIAQSFENAMQLSVTAVQQQAQIDKDIELKNAQIDDVIKATELKAAQINSANAERAVLANNAAKAGAERALLAQKLITEQDSLVTSVAQRNVLTAQSDGFANDAKQKAAEIMIKGFSVVSTTNDLDEIKSADYGVSTTKVKAALDALVP